MTENKALKTGVIKRLPPSNDFDQLTYSYDKEEYITCVFLSLFLEGFINDFGGSHLGDEYFRKHLERMETISKYQVIPRLVTGKELKGDSQHLARLKELIKIRNGIVHPKSEDGYQYTIPSLPNFKEPKRSQKLNLKAFFVMLKDLFLELNEIDPTAHHPDHIRKYLVKVGVEL